MSDAIWGDVTQVVDGDTFDIKVTHIGRNNQNSYGDIEGIRIARIDASELPSRPGQRAGDQLERVLRGKFVRCDIGSRDTFGRLVCDVAVVSKSALMAFLHRL
ncbi:MAG: hypothetical protein HY619_06940 [Thaumarchaeota archaeon]|nr:hypothetical protein [Nitrososphaerota archaeon]